MPRSPDADRRARWRGFEAVPLPITVRVGRARISLARASELAAGDVLVLDRAVGAPFDLYAGDVLLGGVEPMAVRDAVGFKLVSCAGRNDDGA